MNRRQNPSFDYKLFGVFAVGMIIQVLLPIGGLFRILLALLWGGFLVRFAIAHRCKHQWQWRGLTILNSIKGLGVLAVGAHFLLYSVYNFSGILPRFARHTPKPLNITETFSAGINALPGLITGERSLILSFLLLQVGVFILYALVCLRLAYFS